MGVDLRVKNSHSQMIIISILFWKIKYTWAKFLKAVVFGDVSNFEREETVQECELHFSQYIFLGFFFFLYSIMCFGFSQEFYLLSLDGKMCLHSAILVEALNGRRNCSFVKF